MKILAYRFLNCRFLHPGFTAILLLLLLLLLIIIIITVMRHFYNHIFVVTQPTLKVLSRRNRHNMRCLQ